MKVSNAGLAALVPTAFAPQVAPAAELQTGAVKAWNTYVKRADRFMQDVRKGGRHSYGLTNRPVG